MLAILALIGIVLFGPRPGSIIKDPVTVLGEALPDEAATTPAGRAQSAATTARATRSGAASPGHRVRTSQCLIRPASGAGCPRGHRWSLPTVSV